jgi:hypothetical protein
LSTPNNRSLNNTRKVVIIVASVQSSTKEAAITTTMALLVAILELWTGKSACKGTKNGMSTANVSASEHSRCASGHGTE